MIPVNVQWHLLPGAPDIEAISANVRAVYATAGIAMTFTRGAPVADPIGEIFADRSVASVLSELVTQAPAGTIHLLVGTHRSAQSELISGELLDTKSRQLAIVYTGSTYIARRGSTGLTETCIHEIGHALNLTHTDVVDDSQSYFYHSAMEQSGARELANVAHAWTRCGDESVELAKNTHADPLQFGPPAPQTGCLPFAWSARAKIRDAAAADKLLPGTGPHFEGVDQDDRALRSRVELSPEHDRYSQWGVLTLKIKSKFSAAQRRNVPALVGPSYGNLNLIVRRPDGTIYLHRPRTLACVDGQADAGKDCVETPFCTVRGPDGAALTQPGTYKVRAVSSALRLRSPWVEFEVAPRQSCALSTPSVRDALSSGKPLSRRVRSALKGMIGNDRRLEPNTRAYLALALSRGRCNLAEKEHWLRIAAQDRSPYEIRLAAFHARVAIKVRETQRALRKALIDMVKRSLPEIENSTASDRLLGDIEHALRNTQK